MPEIHFPSLHQKKGKYHWMKQIVRLLILSTVIALCSCVSMKSDDYNPVMAYHYIAGSLVRDYPLSYEKAWDTVNTALISLDLSLSHSLKDGSRGAIEAGRPDGTKLSIILIGKNKGRTSIAIKSDYLSRCRDAERLHLEIENVSGI
jgi:hypothetical protein